MPREVRHKFFGVDHKEGFFPEARVKHKDYFHLKDFYRMMHEYFVEHEFVGASNPSFPEKFYSHAWAQNKGEEIHFWWRFNNGKKGGFAGNDYVTWWIDIDVNIFNLKQVEIMKDGVKHKAQFAEPEIKIWGKAVVDPKGTWKSHWFLKTVHELFWKRIYYAKFLRYKRDMINEVYRFEEALKTYFKLATYLPEPEGEQYETTKEFD